MDKNKKILQKEYFIKQNKDLALAKEFVGISDDIENIKKTVSSIEDSISEKLDLISDEVKKKSEEELLYEVDENKIIDSVLEKIVIPKPLDGKNYILTNDDKKEISKLVKIPIVEKIIEKIETIKEPVVTNKIIEVAKYEEPIEIRKKLEKLKGENRLDYTAIKGIENYTTKENLDRAIEILDNRTRFLINKTNNWGSITGNISDQTDLIDLLSGYVPFSGASQNVNLNNKALVNVANIGIGTTSPDSNLHVVGSARITSTFNMGGTNYATNISTYSNGGTFTLQNRGAVNIGISGYNTIINSDNVGIGTTTPATKLQVVGDVKIGEDTTNYAQFGTDGTLRLYGTATVFDDLLGDITGVKTLGTGVSVNAAESTLEYVAAANTSDYAYFNYQLSHKWKIGSVVHPHIHFEQNQKVIPNWLIQYRWQVQGQAKTTAWTNYKTIVPTFTYTTGTLNQIVHDSGITPPAGASLSDIIEIRIIRDTANTSGLFTGADTYTGVASITSADIHYEMDALGSNNEYTK